MAKQASIYLGSLNPFHVMAKPIGIYLGSFNPFHVGHLNVLKRAQMSMGEIVVAQGCKLGKAKPEVPASVEAVGFDRYLYGSRFYQYEGLAADFIKGLNIDEKRSIVLIRGVRNHADEDDANALWFWVQQSFERRIELHKYQTADEFRHISSSAIREIGLYDPKLAKKFIA